MKKQKRFGGYIMEIPYYIAKAKESRNAEARQSEVIQKVTEQFVNELTKRKNDAEFPEQGLKELELQQKVLEKIQRSTYFYEACIFFASYWATREQLQLALNRILADKNFAKCRASHKKMQTFLAENFPQLAIYENDGYIEANVSGIDYSHKKHGEIIIRCTDGEAVYMHNEALKAFVENLELPKEPTEKIVARYIDARHEYVKLMEQADEKVNDLKAKIGYSVYQFQERAKLSYQFYF